MSLFMRMLLLSGFTLIHYITLIRANEEENNKSQVVLRHDGESVVLSDSHPPPSYVQEYSGAVLGAFLLCVINIICKYCILIYSNDKN